MDFDTDFDADSLFGKANRSYFIWRCTDDGERKDTDIPKSKHQEQFYGALQSFGLSGQQHGDLGDLDNNNNNDPDAESGQTLQGSFSAVSKRNFASKYAFESSRRDLHNALLCTAPKSHFFQKISTICQNLRKISEIFNEQFEIRERCQSGAKECIV